MGCYWEALVEAGYRRSFSAQPSCDGRPVARRPGSVPDLLDVSEPQIGALYDQGIVAA